MFFRPSVPTIPFFRMQKPMITRRKIISCIFNIFFTTILDNSQCFICSIQHFAPFFCHKNKIFDTDSHFPFKVNARLDGEDHSRLQHVFIHRRNIPRLMHFLSDAVSGAVCKIWSIAFLCNVIGLLCPHHRNAHLVLLPQSPSDLPEARYHTLLLPAQKPHR